MMALHNNGVSVILILIAMGRHARSRASLVGLFSDATVIVPRR